MKPPPKTKPILSELEAYKAQERAKVASRVRKHRAKAKAAK